ncbi:ABC transporter substrate-binding protein [Nitrosopumilus sp.]|uniref:ABC transporter substrate-binding protein n=1 Tax=Nitrosopumilus sp. TaxID=2024843 RepID=UPI00247EBB11|nr:ABC transporter substrate-binding protein [Nitrosopumilus sp.]MCV0430509.1 ABC transporter substrate-binding protein [Nitrosopumilus sp.]
MKSTQLLSVVFSLIMFTGVTAGNAAFADSDELDDLLEDFCEMTLDERSDIISKYELDEYAEKLAIICDIEDEDERENSLDDVIDAIELETRDETNDDHDDVIEDFEDCVEAGYPIMESYPEQCMIDDGTVFTNTDDDDDRHEDDFDLDDLLDRYCDLSTDKKRQLLEDHPRLAPFTDRLANYCDLSEEEQDAIDELIEEHGDKIRAELRDYAKDYGMDYKKDMRMMLDKYCDMTDAEKKAHVAEHDKAEDHVDKMNRYCALTDEDSRMKFIEEHKDEYKAHMEDKMHDKKMVHMEYERYCHLTDEELAASTFDAEFVKKASEWCEMTPEEKEAFKMEHHEKMGVPHEFDRMSDVAKDRMSDVAKDRMSDVAKDRMSDVAKDKLKMKLSDKSDRIKAMIMDKRDISDERSDEIKKKFIEKHGDLTDKKKSELKMKFKEHIKHMKYKISDERKSAIHDRLAEMKAYKAELREKSSDLSDEEKQELREEFIEKAKDLQLAWITPRTQIAAGVDAAEVECREGYSLVMKASNGVPMCLKADTALKMIDRGIVVPAN